MVTGDGSRWLLLTYRIAREPSAARVGVWRKLKRLGAVLVHDAVWVLPATARTAEQFQWLAAEIRELGGEALLWHASLGSTEEGRALVGQFQEHVDAVYAEIMSALRERHPDLAALSRRFQQARTQDYFNSPLSARTREALLAAAQEVRP